MFDQIKTKVNAKPHLVLATLLVLCNIFFALQLSTTMKKLRVLENEKAQTALNAKVLDFTSLFIHEVLQANTEVNFDTRLKLENSIRDLNDEEIMQQWQKFVGSKTESEAQQSVKNLLGILVSKIR